MNSILINDENMKILHYNINNMKKIIIAFDVDWTLIKSEPYWECNYIPNNRICHLLEILYSFKNVKIIVWSWWGKKHSERAVEVCNLTKFVSKNKCYSKDWQDKPTFSIDIAIDDIHKCDLWNINLIVKEK